MLPNVWDNHQSENPLGKYLSEKSYGYIDILKTQSVVKSVRDVKETHHAYFSGPLE